jgi:hypothetical protein
LIINTPSVHFYKSRNRNSDNAKISLKDNYILRRPALCLPAPPPRCTSPSACSQRLMYLAQLLLHFFLSPHTADRRPPALTSSSTLIPTQQD